MTLADVGTAAFWIVLTIVFFGLVMGTATGLGEGEPVLGTVCGVLAFCMAVWFFAYISATERSSNEACLRSGKAIAIIGSHFNGKTTVTDYGCVNWH